jgi:hypothetical protein
MNPIESLELIFMIIVLAAIFYGGLWLYERYVLCKMDPICYITGQTDSISKAFDNLSDKVEGAVDDIFKILP